MNNKITLSIAALVVLQPAAAIASDAAPGDTIIVTATRTEIRLEDAIVPVEVITREDIELSLANDLSELLRFQAGFDIGRNGGPGQATSTFLRGTESNHTLILVNGVRMNPGTIGGGAIQNISPEVIERIEIVKGARSALFGTDAIGGVINIITRGAPASTVEAGIGFGSFSSDTGYLSAGNRGDNGEVGITIDWQSTDGYAPQSASDIERGYDNLSFNLNASRRFGSNEVSLRHWQADGMVEYLDFFLSPLDQDYRNQTTALQLDSQVSDKGSSKLIVSYMTDDITQNQSDDFVESNRTSIDWQYTHAFEQHTLTAGVFVMQENAESLSFGSGFDEDTDTRALFVQDQWTRDRHSAFVAVRLTDHETFGNETTWNAEYAYDLGDAWTLNAGLARAFRAPDATDRFGFGGDPDLDPELADEMQVGARYAPGDRHSVSIEIFSKDIEDLIEFDLETFTLKNIAEAEIRGVELGYEYRGDTFTLRADAVRQTADNATDDTRLLRRAEESLTVSYTQEIGAHRLGLSVLAAGDREDFGGTRLAGYVLANLSGQLKLSDSWQLNARVENLLDTDYETAAGFPMQERSGFVELKYRWK